METDKKFLSFSVKFLQLLNLWPYKKDKLIIFRNLSFILTLTPCIIPYAADLLLLIYEGIPDLSFVTADLIGLTCIVGMIYMTVCFITNRHLIKKLVLDLQKFRKFDKSTNLEETDQKANLYAKLFMFYGFVGNVVYMTMPYLNREECIKKQDPEHPDPSPCGLVVRSRFPFRFDYSPVFEMVFFHQFYTCTMVSLVILDLSMLLCGILMHITSQLKVLRQYISKLHGCSIDGLKPELCFCVKYHIAIIEYSDEMNEAFSSMMLLHLTLTSLVISVIGFQILIEDNFYDKLRFSLHLLGWIVILFLICSYAQFLINESIAIAEDIYCIPWFKAPAAIQKYVYMILIRSQKPLILRAGDVSFMSLPAFARVIYSAYSYFTLLLNIKN